MQDFDAGASEVDLQTCGAEGGEALDDGDVVAEFGEPEGEGVACDAGADDEDF